MYSTLALSTGMRKNRQLLKMRRLLGTHQKLDFAAREVIERYLPAEINFPSAKEILEFEGVKGPDALKRKSPGEDEPMHFILPDQDDGKLMKMILDHQYNLRRALKNNNRERAAFEAAWMAHAITDGLTPAHHFPYEETIKEMMSDKEFTKIFGTPIKGIMPGEDLLEMLRNNWLHWGAGGYMNKHIGFEMGVAVAAAALTNRQITPKMTAEEVRGAEIQHDFYASLEKIHHLRMYERFRKTGWTADLALESKKILLPEIVRAITLGWAASLPKELVGKTGDNTRRKND